MIPNRQKSSIPPRKWKEFCGLPSDLKEEYLNNLIEKYAAGAGRIAEMFGVSSSSLFRIVRVEGLKVSFPKGRCPAEKQALFEQFLKGQQDWSLEGTVHQMQVEESQTDKESEHSDREVITELKAPEDVSTKMTKFSMCFEGEVDIDMIANSLRLMLTGVEKANIEIFASCIEN